MTKLLIDTSSLVWTSLLAGKDEEHGRNVTDSNGKTVHVNGWQYGYEKAVDLIVSVLNDLSLSPSDCIFVIEGEHSKSRRKEAFAGYKGGPDSRPKEAYEEFNKCKEALRKAFSSIGAQFFCQIGVESDDVIAFLVDKLDGDKVILSQDGDLLALVGYNEERKFSVQQYRHGKIADENPYGPFPFKNITLYKTLVGDSSDKIPGAAQFGKKSFLDMLVWIDNYTMLDSLQQMIDEKTLHELEDDVASFPPLRKIMASAELLYKFDFVVKLHPEWVSLDKTPLKNITLDPEPVTDVRLKPWIGCTSERIEFTPAKYTYVNSNKHAIFDTELIGTTDPIFLFCVKIHETGEKFSFWHHREGDMAKLNQMLDRDDLTWVSFNGIKFDAPITSAALYGFPPSKLKMIAKSSIEDGVSHWKLSSMYEYSTKTFDHIDLFEVAPGVKISLKTFAGRMSYKTMQDMPFPHTQDLTPDQYQIVEDYCFNDIGVTEELFKQLRADVNLRKEMSDTYGIDLRSKSGAQVAEAVLKKVSGITSEPQVVKGVTYSLPSFVTTDNPDIQLVMDRLSTITFSVDSTTGAITLPEFLSEPMRINDGTYQMGIGGLHSTMDKRMYVEATDEMMISDLDVASFYPFIMVNAGCVPANGGEKFMAQYEKMLQTRIEAKRRMQELEAEMFATEKSGNTGLLNSLKSEYATLKSVVATMKLTLVSTFGKLGSPYCSFYAPDLMLAVTLTGQLSLLCLIHDLEKIKGVKVISANTDGIVVHYHKSLRDSVISVMYENARRTGFEYEETPYSKLAMKDVNNYIGVTQARESVIITPTEVVTQKAGKVKAKTKGLYAALGLMKNPSMQVCSNMVVDYLKDGIAPEESIKKYRDMRDFVAIRNVSGGAIQYDAMVEVDDWICVKDLGTKDNEWARAGWEDGRVVRRKSKPAPVKVGLGGTPLGRLVRWYMSTDDSLGDIASQDTGSRVAKTEGGRACMTLPDQLPPDLDYGWYIAEAHSILRNIGVQ